MTRIGAGPLWGLLGLALLAVLGIVWLRSGSGRPGAPAAALPATIPSSLQGAVEDSPVSLRTAPSPPPEEPAPARAGDARPLLRGVLELGEGVLEPSQWRLVARDAGGAVAHELTRAGAERAFELALAPGAYTLTAEAPGHASLPASLELPRSTDVTLILEPLCALAGAVVVEGGAGLDGVALHWRRGRTIERSVSTDPVGAFLIADLVRGAGELVLGDPRGPLVPPRTLDLSAGFLDLGNWSLPSLGELELRVLDAESRPVEGASLSGRGSLGGWIETRSDPDGRARAERLPKGMYRVFATHPDHGRGNAVFEYVPEQPAEVEIRLRRPATGG